METITTANGVLTPLSPSRTISSVRISFMQMGNDIKEIMGQSDELEVRKSIILLTKRLLRETKEYSIALFIKNEQVVVGQKSTEDKLIWNIATKLTGCTDNMCLVEITEDTLNLKEHVITDAALIKKESMNKNEWWISMTACKSRLESLLTKYGDSQLRREFVPALHRITSDGVKINITRSNITQEMEKNCLEIKKITKLPEIIPTRKATKQLIVHKSVRDERLKRQLQQHRNYVVTEQYDDENKYNMFLKVIVRITRMGKPDEECLRMLHSVDGRENSKSKYRIGAYLVNANMFLEYTRNVGGSKTLHWFPLRFKKNNDSRFSMKPIKDEKREALMRCMGWINYNRIQPRILCILQERNGKKIVNTCVYDTYNLRQSIKDEIPFPAKHVFLPASLNMALDRDSETKRTMTKKIENAPTKRNVTNQTNEENGNDNTNTQRDILPVIMMAQSDEREGRKKKYNWDWSENEEEQNREENGKDRQNVDTEGISEDVSSDCSDMDVSTMTSIEQTENDDNNNKETSITINENTNNNEDEQERLEKKNGNKANDECRKTADRQYGEMRIAEDNMHSQTENQNISNVQNSLNSPHNDSETQNSNEQQKEKETNKNEEERNLSEKERSDKVDLMDNNKRNNEQQSGAQNASTQDVSSEEIEQEDNEVSKDQMTNTNEINRIDKTDENQIERNDNNGEPHEPNIEEYTIDKEDTQNINSARNEENEQPNKTIEVINSIPGNETENLNKSYREENNEDNVDVQSGGKGNQETQHEEIQLFSEEQPPTINGEHVEEISIDSINGDTSHNNGHMKDINTNYEKIECYAKCGEKEIEIVVHLDKELIKDRKVNIIFKCTGIENVREGIFKTGTNNKNIKVNASNNSTKSKSTKNNKTKTKQTETKKNNGKNKENSPNLKQWLNQQEQTEIEERVDEQQTNNNQNERISTVDIYGSNKGNIYRSPWKNLFGETKRVRNKDIRRIPKLEKEKFINECYQISPATKIRGWLNLPRVLSEVLIQPVSETTLTRDEQDLKYLAITQFYRGAWGKAMSTLMVQGKKMIKMNDDQINTLFPRCEGDREIDEECDMAQYKGTQYGLIMGNEIQSGITKLAKGRSAGLSGLTYEIIKEVGSTVRGRNVIKDTLTEIYNNPDKVPDQLYTARLVGIEKPNGGARPLCMQEAITKLLHKILADRITTLVSPHIAEYQKCMSLAEGLMEARNRVVESIQPGCTVIQYDFTNAFGTIRRTKIIERLKHYQVPQPYIRYIAKMLRRQKIEWEGEDGKIRTMSIETGVPQGEPLAMLLFALGVDKIIQDFNQMEDVTMTAYADDIIMVIQDNDKMLEMIENFEKVAKEHGLSCNASKMKIGVTVGIPEDIMNKLNEKEIKVLNLKEEMMEYVGLPITLSEEKEEQFIREKVQECVKTTKDLWENRVPLQMKYHLQKLCVDSTLTHIMKVAPMRDEKWMTEIQNELEQCWSKYLPVMKEKYARIPTKYYGLGMLNIKDRRYIIRKQWENRNKRKENKDEPRIDVEYVYYKEKIRKWAEKGLIQNINVDSVPKESNYSLARPPDNVIHRMSDEAFRLLITLRYCSREMDDIYSELNSDKRRMCPTHKDTPLDIQHTITCNRVMNREKIRRHNQIVSKVCKLLHRNKNIKQVTPETYSVYQKRQFKDRKRADITYRLDKKEHSVDVKVTSSWVTKAGNNITRAIQEKRKQYKNEDNVHMVIFDTAGNATNETISYLRMIKASPADIREMQKVILEFTATGIQNVNEDQKNKEFIQHRNRQRWERRRIRRGNYEDGNANEIE